MSEEGVQTWGNKSVLWYVVHEEVAGITGGEAPGGAWLSLRQDRNTPGAYAAGMLKLQPSVS
jgi:hypothetical protein